MNSKLTVLVAASALALLSACGGNDSSSTPGNSSVTISSTNQSDVARATVNGGLAVSLAQGAIGGGASTASVTTRSHALGAALQRVLAHVANQRRGVASASVHASAVTSTSSACDVGGTLNMSFDDKDGNNQLSNGDVLTGTFAQCRDGQALTVNGTVVITISGTPTETQFTAAAQFQNLVVLDAGVSSTISGAATITENDTSTQSSTTIAVGSAGLDVAVASSGYNDALAFDSGTTFTTLAGDTSDTLTVNGSFTAQSIGGRVTIATLIPLTQDFVDAYPHSGLVRVTGASGSTLQLTVLSATQVQLQLDANGDGNYESGTTVAWSTLVP